MQRQLQGYEKTDRKQENKTRTRHTVYKAKQRPSGKAELVSQQGKSMIVMMKRVQFLSEVEFDPAGLVWMEGKNGEEKRSQHALNSLTVSFRNLISNQ